MKRAQCGHLTTVARQFQKAREDAGLPNDLVLYSALYGFGTEMYRANKNLFVVMKVMGHSAVATTMKYQDHDIDETAQVASQGVQEGTQKRHNRPGTGLVKAAKCLKRW